jgi:hypothetical protein
MPELAPLWCRNGLALVTAASERIAASAYLPHCVAVTRASPATRPPALAPDLHPQVMRFRVS